MKPHVAIDIDGCLFPWDEAAAEALEEKFGYTGLVRVSETWDHLREMVDPEHWKWLFTPEGGEATLDKPTLFYPGVPEGLHRIAEVAHVSFITHRPSGAAACTARWIASHGCAFRSLHVIGDAGGDHSPKSSVQPQADIYIEDRAHNVLEILEGTVAALVLMPKLAHNVELHGEAECLTEGVIDKTDKWAGRLLMYQGFTQAVEFIEGYCSE